MKNQLWLLVLLLTACHSKSAQEVQVKLVNGQKSAAVIGIDAAILNDIDRDSVKNWQSLAVVFKMPADTTLKDYQPIQPGRYQVKDGLLVFTPDTPFVKQQVYFLRYYQYAGGKSIWDYLRGKTAKGQLHYTDLIFKQ